MFLSGIFREVVVSRKGAYSCPVASGVIFAVDVDVRGAGGAHLGAYSQGLLASMQARQRCRALQTARSAKWRWEACVRRGWHVSAVGYAQRILWSRVWQQEMMLSALIRVLQRMCWPACQDSIGILPRVDQVP